MRNCKILLLVLLIAVAATSCAQPAFVQNVQAYTALKKLGRMPVNLEGMEVSPEQQKLTTVYIETKSANPKWGNATINNQSYNVVASAIKSPVEIGVNKITNKKVIVKAKPGNKLWLLELTPSDDKAPKANSDTNKIIIRGKNNNKPFDIKVKKVTELELPDAV